MMYSPAPAHARYARRRRSGFSLVEMIGVLAIIAILAVVIVPKVFSTIASSRVTATVASINSIKTAVTEFAGKYGAIPTTTSQSRIDDLLVTAQITEGRFVSKIGSQPGNPMITGSAWARDPSDGTWTANASGAASQTGQSRIICLTSNANLPSNSSGANYRLNGAVDLPAGARVISAVLVNLTATEAHELSLRIDGDTFSQADATTADDAGKVVYLAPNGQGFTTAYVYVTHQ